MMLRNNGTRRLLREPEIPLVLVSRHKRESVRAIGAQGQCCDLPEARHRPRTSKNLIVVSNELGLVRETEVTSQSQSKLQTYREHELRLRESFAWARLRGPLWLSGVPNEARDDEESSDRVVVAPVIKYPARRSSRSGWGKPGL
jgi:hypothetical protein